MHEAWERVSAEPALVAGAVMGVLNVVVVLDIWRLTETQLGTINTAVAAVLALVVRATVSPNHGTPMHAPRLRRGPNPAH